MLSLFKRASFYRATFKRVRVSLSNGDNGKPCTYYYYYYAYYLFAFGLLFFLFSSIPFFFFSTLCHYNA